MLDRIYWIVPGQMVVFEVINEVKLDDVRELIEKIRVTIEEEAPARYVDVLLDVSRVTGYHPDTMNIRKLFGAVRRDDRVRWNIIVNPRPHPVLDFVIRTVCQLFKTQLSIVPSLDSALEFIQAKTV
jgi:hypothetical protein